MDNLRLLIIDEDESSSHSTVSEHSSDSDAEQLFPDDNVAVRSDDDGYDSVGNASEPEELIIDKRYPSPQPPPPSSMPFIMFDDVVAPVINLNRRPRRLEDRYHPYSRELSFGYEDSGHPLRRALRASKLVQGQGTFNGFRFHLEPRRITGAVVKHGQLFYFVDWIGGMDRPQPLESHVMARYSPNLVIKYHQELMTNHALHREL